MITARSGRHNCAAHCPRTQETDSKIGIPNKGKMASVTWLLQKCSPHVTLPNLHKLPVDDVTQPWATLISFEINQNGQERRAYLTSFSTVLKFAFHFTHAHMLSGE